MSGATNAWLTFGNVQMTQAGHYSVQVTNAFGSILSSNALLTVLPTGSCLPASPGLVGWWRGGGNAFDRAGTNHGTLTGNATFGPGRVGLGFVFDGSGDAARLGNPADVQLQDFTIEAWIQRASASAVSLGGGGLILSYGSGGYGLGMDGGGHLVLTRLDVNGVTGNTRIGDTSWHHVAVTKSGSQVVFYVDGGADPVPAYDAGGGFAFSTAVAIGARGDNLGNSFLGTIDELAIYQRPLSAAEIQAVYNAGSPGKCAADPPLVFSQPINQTVFAGANVSFNVLADSPMPVGYQWIFNGTNIVSGATNAWLTFSNVQMTQAGNYSVQVTNVFGSILSSNALLTVLPTGSCFSAPPGLVSWWPGRGNAMDEAGFNHGTLTNNVSFAPGRVGLGFVFDGNGAVVQLGNPANLRLQDFTIEAWIQRASDSSVSWGGSGLILSYGSGGYGLGMDGGGHLFLSRLDVNGVTGSASISDTNWHHVAVTKNGSAVVFYVDGGADPVPAYDSGGGFTFSTGVAIGVRSDNLRNGFFGIIDELAVYDRALSGIEIQAIHDAGASGKCGADPPLILSQPTEQLVFVGSGGTFSAVADGTQPLSYQWLINGTNVPGATNATLNFPSVTTSNAGTYVLVVSNINGFVLSSNTVLTVVTQPQNQTTTFGGTASFIIEIAGPPALSQWQKDGVDIAGATNLTLTLSNVGPEILGDYQVIVSNGAGSITSAVATLTLNPLIRINGDIASSFSFTNVDSVEVTISSTFANASIFYTLDGSEPDFTSAPYSAPFNLTQSALVRAVAYDSSFNAVQAAPVAVSFWFLYPLTVVNPGGGSVSLNPPGGVYRNDMVVQATAIPSPGWSFQKWNQDAEGTDPTINVTMEKAKTVQATFATIVSAATNQNGSIRFNPALDAYPYGSSVQLSAIPNPGYYFGLWGGSAYGNENPFVMTVTNATPVVTALFAALGSNNFALIVILNGNGTITVSPRFNSFTNGQSVTLTANPLAADRFLLWSGDANTKTNPLALKMDSSKIITANFTGGDYPIRFHTVTRLPGDLLQFSFSGEPEARFRVQISRDLLSWSDLLVVTNEGGTSRFIDGPVTEALQKFYRAAYP